MESFTDVDAALSIEVPDEAIVHRMAGRRTCPKCGSTETEKLLSACASHTKGGAVSTTSVTSANGSSGCSGCSGGSCASCGGCAH